MPDPVAAFYTGTDDLVTNIAEALQHSGKDIEALKADDLAVVDEFHIRGRKATEEVAAQMNLDRDSRVLDIGGGMGGAARTVVGMYDCHVTGIELTPAFCQAANILSQWVGLTDRVTFQQGDATDLPFADDAFDAAMTIHAAMNIPAKDRMYAEARRVVKPGGIFAVYDVVQGEGGDVIFPVPWAREPSISFLATPDEMVSLLTEAGFDIVATQDTTDQAQRFFEAMTARMEETGESPVKWRAFLGDQFPEMARNQVRNVTDRRIRTLTYICRA
jgi:ubiquinone/menaquinone biosynthesis C-methylase UbiE